MKMRRITAALALAGLSLVPQLALAQADKQVIDAVESCFDYVDAQSAEKDDAIYRKR